MGLPGFTAKTAPFSYSARRHLSVELFRITVYYKNKFNMQGNSYVYSHPAFRKVWLPKGRSPTHGSTSPLQEQSLTRKGG